VPVVVGLLLVGSEARPALAQPHLALDQHRPGESPDDGFAISRPVGGGHLDVAAQLQLDYSHDPLVYESRLGDASTETQSVVSDQLVLHPVVAMGLGDRWVVALGVPVGIRSDGAGLAGRGTPDGAVPNDVWLGLRGVVLGDRDDAFALAAQLTGTVPTARIFGSDGSEAFAGSSGPTGEPELLLEVRPGPVRLAVNLGARLRRTEAFDSLSVGNDLTYGLGAWAPLRDGTIEPGVEAHGATAISDPGDREASPLEALAGVRLRAGGFSIGLATGAGITRGYGSPDLRVVSAVGWMPVQETPRVEWLRPVSADRSESGDERAASRHAGHEGGDERSGADDGGGAGEEHGDGVAGDAAIPPEDRDGDRDGVPDPADRCPAEPEDRDDVRDEDGCPETDADQDAVDDPADRCPLTPGISNPQNPQCAGCPALACADESGQIRILERVEFETGSAAILPESERVLGAVGDILGTNPDLRLVRIEGHTDDRGDDAMNLDLSRQRAESVKRWLVEEYAIEAGRLSTEGVGEARPLVANDDRANRRRNRRVEFHLADAQIRSSAPEPD